MDPGVIAAIIGGVAIVIAAVIGLWKSSAGPRSSVRTGSIQSGRDTVVSGRDTHISRAEVNVETLTAYLSPDESSVEVTITAVELGRAKLDWSPKETIRGEFASEIKVRFEWRDQDQRHRRYQPVVIDFTIEEYD